MIMERIEEETEASASAADEDVSENDGVVGGSQHNSNHSKGSKNNNNKKKSITKNNTPTHDDHLPEYDHEAHPDGVGDIRESLILSQQELVVQDDDGHHDQDDDLPHRHLQRENNTFYIGYNDSMASSFNNDSYGKLNGSFNNSDSFINDNNININLSDEFHLTLEEMAYDMERSLPIKDNRYNLTIYKKTFIGSECVDYLVRSNFASSRANAVDLGRRMAKELNLFEHVTLDHELKDDYYFYRFIELERRTYRTNPNGSQDGGRAMSNGSNNSSNHSRGSSSGGSTAEYFDGDGTNEIYKLQASQDLSEIANILIKEIYISDRTYRLRKYKQVFVASEVITVMIELNLVNSREEGVELGRRLQKELNLWHHVCRHHIFKDDYLFFRLTKKSQGETTDGVSASSSGESSGDYMDSNGLDYDEYYDYNSISNPMDLMSDTHSIAGESVVSISVSVQDMTAKQLHSVAEQLRRGLRVKDRRYRLKIYKKCFVASEAVDFMVKENLARSREEAVDLGRLLATKFRLWYHVTNDHQFSDKYLFFRFAPALDQQHFLRYQYNRRQHHGSSATSYGPKSTGNVVVSASSSKNGGASVSSKKSNTVNVISDDKNNDADEKSRRDSFSNNSGSDLASMSSYVESEKSLSGICSKLIRGLQVRDRTYKLKTYKNCFVGSEAVDFMVQARIVSSREEAVELGQRLMIEKALFFHVKKQHTFKDEYLFYRFSSSAIYNADGEDGSFSSTLVDDITASIAGDGRDISKSSRSGTLSVTSSRSTTTSSITSLSPDELEQVGDQLRRGVRIKNRSYRLKMYKNCFIGSEAVDYLVQSGLANSREAAVDIGRRLGSELNFLRHVTDDHQFQDGYLFFQFNTIDRTKSTTSSFSGSSRSSSLSSSAMLREFDHVPAQNAQRIQFERNPSLRRAEFLRLRQMKKEISTEPRVVLVGGPSGCGKTILVQHAFAEDYTVVYGASKFDQRSNQAPFQALRLLFTDLSKRLRFSPHILAFREKLSEEFRDVKVQQSALTTWIPEMRALFTEATDDDHLKRKSDVINVLKLALQSFLRAICAVTPVVLCMDDIMWSDKDTLDILQFLLNRGLKNLLFCATYRDEVVSDNHQLFDWRSEVSEEVELETIQLRNLTKAEIGDFLAHCLRREPEDIMELGGLLLERTHGNLFFLVQTLESLQDLSLLYYDYARMQWTFSVDQIRSKTLVADNVGELLSTRIEQLPRDVQQVMKLGSCFGSGFDPEILERTKSVLFIFEDIYICLQLACKEELLIRVSDREYFFAHDHVQAASYRLLPKGKERRKIHWDIGYKLATKQLSRGEDDAGYYFACADQMNLSDEVMFEQIRDDDRPRIARIFHKAGEQAASMSAFVPAAAYCKTGIDLLGSTPEKAFSIQYDLAAKLFICYAKTQLSAGRVAESRLASDSVLANAQTQEHKRAANLNIFHCLSAENKLEEQVDFGLRLLEELGHKLPKCPNFVQVKLEFDRTRLSLRGYTDQEILRIPPMSDKTVEFCIDLMCDLCLSGNNLRMGTFVCFTLARLVQLTLKHGMCKFTPFIFALVGQDVIASFNDLKEGYRYLQVGLLCQSVIEAAEEKGRLLTQSCMALGCVEPISKCMYLGLDAYKASMEVGDMHIAFHGASVYLWSFFYSGLPFGPLLDDVEKFALQFLEYKQYTFFFLTIPIFQLLLCLSGQEDDPCDITKGRAINMINSVEVENQEDTGKELLQGYGMQLAFYMGDIEQATEYYEASKDATTGVARATIAHHTHLFFFALICIENFRLKGKSKFKNEAKKYMDTLRELVEDGAINLVQKVQLLDAEFMSLTSKDEREVIPKYEKAIKSASRAGFLQDGALGNYLCAQYCVRNEDEVSAESYATKSYELYSTWGAVAVAESVEARNPLLFVNSPSTTSMGRLSNSGLSRTHFRESFALMHKSLSRRRPTRLNPTNREE